MDRFPTGPQISRRHFLRIAGFAGAGLMASRLLRVPAILSRRAEAAPPRLGYWGDPKTWGGKVPGTNDLVVISKKVILNVDARVRGLIIKPSGHLIFHPRRSVTLRSAGNIVVRGRLSMRPRRPALDHRLLFPSVDERRFVGGGMKVLTSDIGLWVTGKGAVDVAGSPKLAWSRASGAVPAGSTSIVLQNDPVGWRVGDEIILTPTLSPTHPNQDVAYDVGTVVAIDRLMRRITLRSPTIFEHPAVEVEPGIVLTAEVLNLTRNVRIEGSPSGRSHVWLRSSRPQSIRNALIRYMGPRSPIAETPSLTKPVAGRYGLHFHLMKGGSSGSVVKGVVIRDSGNHAFVTHQSHGVTFRDCISHDTFGDAYWWDPSTDAEAEHAPPTDDVLYDRCVASMVRSEPFAEGLRMAGFFLGARQKNTIRNCVAVGVLGELDSSGYGWPETSEGLWTFQDCVAHNNRMNGITAWQTNALPQVIQRFTAYHNGRFGILHGHYISGFLYRDSVLYGNRFAALVPLAVSSSTPVQVFFGLRCDQAGLSPYCVVAPQRIAPPEVPVQFVGCRFRGYSKAAFAFVDEGSAFPNLFSIINCSFEGNEFWLGPSVHPSSAIRVHDSAHGVLTLRRADQPGLFRPEWNASVSSGG